MTEQSEIECVARAIHNAEYCVDFSERDGHIQETYMVMAQDAIKALDKFRNKQGD